MILSVFIQIANVFALLAYVYFSVAVLYILVFAFASIFKYKHKKITNGFQRKFAILIPAYKADAIIEETVIHALKQDYPKDKFDVVVICDKMKGETINLLKSYPINPLVVHFEQSNKARSLNKCMDEIGDNYDVCVVLDADNIAAPDFLNLINDGFNNGYKVVQGHRVAKNVETSFALLDAASEEINNSIFRKGHRVLGVSSALIGSGMGIDYALYKSYMKQIDAVGEDKEMELMLLSNGIEIEYISEALVYDEKTSEADNFRRQRSRWIAAQTEYVNAHFVRSFKTFITKGNFDYFDKALQFVLPPRILMLGILGFIAILLCTLALFNVEFLSFLNWVPWTILFACTQLALLIALPRKFYSLKTLKAILSIPLAFVMMLGSLTQFKKARTHFIATEHKASKERKK